MMWDYDALIAKARIYFERADAVNEADDDAFAIWVLLGLEFLLRAPLARVHPVLLADPTGTAVLHAAGIAALPDDKEPKSIQLNTVIERLVRVIDAFTRERADDATLLAALRNRELHTGEAVLQTVPVSQWLPRFTRVAEVICDHLSLDASELIGAGIINQGRALVGEENEKLAHEVSTRIQAAQSFVAQLMPDEIHERERQAVAMRDAEATCVACPSCEREMPVELERIRVTDERLEDDEFRRDVVSIARAFRCVACGLELTSTKEIAAARLDQQYTTTETESFADRFLSSYVEDDYGND